MGRSLVVLSKAKPNSECQFVSGVVSESKCSMIMIYAFKIHVWDWCWITREEGRRGKQGSDFQNNIPWANFPIVED